MLNNPLKRARFPTPREPTNLVRQLYPSPSRKSAKLSLRSELPRLRFTPYAWAKLLFLRDYGPTEVGGFGVCPSETLLVEDIQLVRQRASYVTVEFDDVGVADMFENLIDDGLRPNQFARIWLHTHPGKSPHPSGTDEATFARVFGQADWALMFILARSGANYARIRIGQEPCVEVRLRTVVDYSREFEAADQVAWANEYEVHVVIEEFFNPSPSSSLSWLDKFYRQERNPAEEGELLSHE